MGMGLGVSLGMNALRRAAVASGPSDPTGLTSVALWLRAMSGKVLDDAGNPATNGANVGAWNHMGTTTRDAQQTNLGQYPTLEIAGGKYWVHGGDQLSMALSSPVLLDSNFVMWIPVKRPTAKECIIFSTAGGNGVGFEITALNQIILTDDQGGHPPNNAAPFTGTNDGALWRLRRSSNVLYFSASGMAEISLGDVTGLTWTITDILGDPTDGTFGDSTCAIGEPLICIDSATAAAPPASIDGPSGYIKNSAYLGSTAWGVSL